MEGEIRLDPLEFLRDLHSRDISYLLVGRQALVLLGAPLVTADYDFFLSPERDPLEALLELAEERGLELSVGDPEKRPFFSLLGDTLKLDFFRCRAYSPKEGAPFTFEEIYSRKRVCPIADFAIYIPTIPDLIRIKRVRNSPRDQEDIKYLQVLLEREARLGNRHS